MTNTVVSQFRAMRHARTAAAVGSLVGAVAASSCCMLPLVLFMLGVSGAWIGSLVRLAPYQPYFIAASIACLSCGYWLVYRWSLTGCAEDRGCGSPAAERLVKNVLVLATFLVVIAIAFDIFVPLLNT